MRKWLATIWGAVSARPIRQWVIDRFALRRIWQYVLARRVAKGAWYYGDGATLLLLFGVLLVTGAFMTLSYSASTEEAYDSVRYITEHQTMGWFVRGLHYWSAGMMMVMLFFHLFRQVLIGGYKAPREGTWLVGVLLFWAVLVLAFTGYVLRWDERAVYAMRVALSMFRSIPGIGDHVVMFIQGGPDLSSFTLTRIYSVHIVFAPLTLMALLAYHLYLVVVHSITSPTERERPVATAAEQREVYRRDAMSEERGEPFYPDTAAKSGLMAMIIFIAVALLAVLVGPSPLHPQANLVDPARPIAEWWYWWYSAIIAMMPPAAAPVFMVAFPLLLTLALILAPFVDRSPYRGIRHRPIAATFVAACVVALLYLSYLRYDSPWMGHPFAGAPPAPAGMTLTPEAERGRLLFGQFGCSSCHAIDGVGPRLASDLAKPTRAWSQADLRAYILEPPQDVAMPPYRGRLTDDEVDRIVDFVHVVQTADGARAE
jgi:ubiquinol-cytochrome c reductase cytochrome b subunit